jgi:hypothetical protein
MRPIKDASSLDEINIPKKDKDIDSIEPCTDKDIPVPIVVPQDPSTFTRLKNPEYFNSNGERAPLDW